MFFADAAKRSSRIRRKAWNLDQWFHPYQLFADLQRYSLWIRERDERRLNQFVQQSQAYHHAQQQSWQGWNNNPWGSDLQDVARYQSRQMNHFYGIPQQATGVPQEAPQTQPKFMTYDDMMADDWEFERVVVNTPRTAV